MRQRRCFQVCDDVDVLTCCWIVAPSQCNISLDDEETEDEINESAYFPKDERGTKSKSGIQASTCRCANHKANGETCHCESKLPGNVLLWGGITEEGEAHDPNHGRTDALEDTRDSHEGVVGGLHKEDLSAQESEETNGEGSTA
jgi:hypothetical protein